MYIKYANYLEYSGSFKDFRIYFILFDRIARIIFILCYREFQVWKINNAEISLKKFL